MCKLYSKTMQGNRRPRVSRHRVYTRLPFYFCLARTPFILSKLSLRLTFLKGLGLRGRREWRIFHSPFEPKGRIKGGWLCVEESGVWIKDLFISSPIFLPCFRRSDVSLFSCCIPGLRIEETFLTFEVTLWSFLLGVPRHSWDFN